MSEKPDEPKAELARLLREVREARAAIGERWFAGGVDLPEALRRKFRALELLAPKRRRRRD